MPSSSSGRAGERVAAAASALPWAGASVALVDRAIARVADRQVGERKRVSIDRNQAQGGYPRHLLPILGSTVQNAATSKPRKWAALRTNSRKMGPVRAPLRHRASDPGR